MLIMFANFVIITRGWRKWTDSKQLNWFPLLFFVNGFAIAVLLLPWEG